MKSGASVNDKNALGQTSLEIAASNGHTEAAKALISGGGLFLKMTCDFFVKSIILL